MKKTARIIISILIFILFVIDGFAVDVATVNPESVEANAGESIAIPIVVENNPGIMGFRITVNYPPTVFINPKVEMGSLLRTGMFDDDIIASKKGTFDVLWSNSENIIGDGPLFIVSFKISDDAVSGLYRIDFANIQDDTFNENWDDVKIEFAPVFVTVRGMPADEESMTATSARSANHEDENDTIQREITVPTTEQHETKRFDDPDALSTEQATAESRTSRIVQLADEVLKDFGVQTIDQIPEEKQKDFAQSVQEKLKAEETSEEQDLSFEDISRAYRYVNPIKEVTGEKPTTHSKIIIPLSIFLIGVIIITYYIIKKLKRGKVK